MSSARNHRDRSHRSYAKHRSACSGHARRTIYRLAPKKRLGLLELLELLRRVFKPRGRKVKGNAE